MKLKSNIFAKIIYCINNLNQKIMHRKYSNQINSSLLHHSVQLCGWVHCCRRLSKIVFLDLRDTGGIIQVTFLKKNKELFKLASSLKNEFCIRIEGLVHKKHKQNEEKLFYVHGFEILATSLQILNKSATLSIDQQVENSKINELKYRYLILRMPKTAHVIKTRSLVYTMIRSFMQKNNFLEIETPLLVNPSPQGARDYLIPSRTCNKKFYALPQSPQIFKQLLMISGFDRYYQIAKCFRDEDLRSDRQAEFTQIDFEMSFVDAQVVQNFAENLIREIWYKVKNHVLQKFPTLTFKDAIKLYGSDKPDLRNPIKFFQIQDSVFKYNLNYAVNGTLSSHNITVIHIPLSFGILPDREIIKYIDMAKNFQIKLTWLRYSILDKNCVGSITKFLPSKIIKQLISQILPKNGDVVLLGFGEFAMLNKTMSYIRKEIGEDLKIISDQAAPLWINEYPMFELDSKSNSFASVHHPFTAPKGELDFQLLENSPISAVSSAYDVVINGHEIGGGSVRINNSQIQKKIFEILGMQQNTQVKDFGFMLKALDFGTPPHAGLAFGLDRLMMLLVETNDIKDVIAFPKTTSGCCALTETPKTL